MTPTPEQLAAVLPRCQAGLKGGDWSEDDERLKWATRALHYVKLAMERAPEPFQWSNNGFMALSDRILNVKYGDVAEISRDDLDLALRFDTGPMTKTEALAAAEDGKLVFYGRRVKLVDDAPSAHESDEQWSGGTHGPREPEIDAERKVAMAQALNAPEPADEAFELTKALRALVEDPPPPGENWRDGLWWNGRYWQTVTQAWPPPAKGTHESDVSYGWTTSEDALIGHHDHIHGPGAWQEYDAAMNWSRSR